MEMEKLQNRIYEFEKKHRSSTAFQKEEAQKELREIAKEITELLEDNFILKIESYDDFGETNKILGLINNSKKYHGKGFFWGEAYGLETPMINKSFFINNSDKIFLLFFLDYQFEDSKKIITITHDGDLKIEEK